MLVKIGNFYRAIFHCTFVRSLKIILMAWVTFAVCYERWRTRSDDIYAKIFNAKIRHQKSWYKYSFFWSSESADHQRKIPLFSDRRWRKSTILTRIDLRSSHSYKVHDPRGTNRSMSYCVYGRWSADCRRRLAGTVTHRVFARYHRAVADRGNNGQQSSIGGVRLVLSVLPSSYLDAGMKLCT